MAYVPISQKDVDEAYKRYFPKHGGLKEDYFTLLYLTREFGLDEKQALEQTGFLGNDYGMDGYFFSGPEKKILHIVQCKWSKDYFLFKDSLQRLADKGLERVFGNLSPDENENPIVNRLRNSVYENKPIIDRVWLRLVFNGDEKAADDSPLMKDYREDLESKKYVLEEFLGHKVDLITQFFSNSSNEASNLELATVPHKYIIPSHPGHLAITKDDGSTMRLEFVSLRTLLEMYLDFGEKLFERNIRSSYGFTQSQSLVNSKIKASLKQSIIDGKQPIEDFTFFHNGVTIRATSLQEIDGKMSLFEPRILNGAQTVSTANEFYELHKVKRDILERLDQVKVPAKIIVSNTEKFVKQVAINNNRQNPIEPWHLRANEKEQLEFEERFRRQGIYYERRENSYSNEKPSKLEEMGILQDKPLKIKTFGQMLLATQGQVSRMSTIGETFETESQYHEMFKEKYLTGDLREFVLFYKIQYGLSKLVYAIEDLGEKYSYAPKSRYLTWALLIQGLANDDAFESYLKKYGTSLTMQADYREVLGKIATSRIRFIYSLTFDRDPYYSEMHPQDPKKKPGFGFLRRKSTFDDCMETARKKFRWQSHNF
jgi:AIPR protein